MGRVLDRGYPTLFSFISLGSARVPPAAWILPKVATTSVSVRFISVGEDGVPIKFYSAPAVLGRGFPTLVAYLTLGSARMPPAARGSRILHLKPCQHDLVNESRKPLTKLASSEDRARRGTRRGAPRVWGRRLHLPGCRELARLY